MPIRRMSQVAILCVFATACFVIHKKSVEDLPPTAPRAVESPIRVFMADGSLVLFRGGSVITDSSVTGDGRRYDLFRQPGDSVGVVPLDSVLGIEALTQRVDPGPTLLASVGVTTITIGGGIALYCATNPKCFGSCPTIYSTEDGEAFLEAEAFSYSISPLLESRDLDRLEVGADEHGFVELEIRNEALETHYINQIELVEIRHGAGERAWLDNDRHPAVVGRVHAFDEVKDRAGRDVTGVLGAQDDRVFKTAVARIASATSDDSRDRIEAVVPAVDADTVAVVLRLRNSLLNTVLFYELMLGGPGARALDWMARDIERIGAAVELGTWYHETMGLRLEVQTDDGFVEVGRVGDSGPIAWSEVAFRLPARRGRATRFRLSFLTDEWRIDRLGWSEHIARSDGRTIPVSSLVPHLGQAQPELIGRIAAPDDEYIVTSAGTGFVVGFDVGPEPAAGRRSFLLVTQGYYTEWVRPHWIRTGTADEPFRPTADVIPELMRRWLELMPAMEGAFHATRIPVR